MAELDGIFRKATEREPARRYHSMNAMADDLGELLGFPTAPAVMRIQQIRDGTASDPSPTVAISPSAGHLILARIPAGSLAMGSSENYFGNESPVRRVSLTRDFLLGVYPVTQGQYRRLMGDAASPYFAGIDAAPMENVTWLDAIHFCNALSEVEDLPPYYRIDGERVSCRGGHRLPPADRGRVGIRLPRGQLRQPIPSATTRHCCLSTPGSRTIRATRSSRSDTGRRTRSACTTCTATSGNGAGTGMGPMTRPSAPIRRARRRDGAGAPRRLVV